MALPQQESANVELRNDATEARASSSSSSSSSSSEAAAAAAAMPSSIEEARAHAGAKQQQAAATPPPTQQMERHSSSDSDGEAAGDPGRIPAEVFERDPAEASSKDWSMMSTDSVFGLQVAPSSDFTGFFLAHPELMDISTPPRASMVSAEADAAVVIAPPFESIPELSEATIKGNYSFAFPNLIEDKRHSSKKVQDEQPPATAAATTEAAQAAPAPVKVEAQASTKPVAAPENEPAKGGLFACFPCCS
ncbi:hypothetical protein QOZ80_6BG0461070 [Eleusine coracana subsp. coracana]|nr:hypothetical protein QOZ80_6BG0461070 [Eleusine coracana subsp. coracana]